MATLGQKINKITYENNIHLSELAQELGTSQQYVSQIVNDATKLSIEVLQRIANFLGVTVEYLISDDSRYKLFFEYLNCFNIDFKQIIVDTSKYKDKSNYERVSKNIRYICKEKGISTNKLSELTNLSSVTIYNIMSKKCIAKFESILCIAMILGVTVETLYSD